MSELTLALDIGGTKIAAGLVDADGTLVTSAQEPTPHGDDPEAVGVGDAGELPGEVCRCVDRLGLEVRGGLSLRSGREGNPLGAVDVGTGETLGAGSSCFDGVPDVVEVEPGERGLHRAVRGEGIGQDFLDRHLLEFGPVVVDELAQRSASDGERED